MQKCYLALGCFWKPEETFRHIKGIVEIEVGYAGGNSQKVTYEEVCEGNTGHAETVKITYDEKIISYEKILEVFFKIHDPTQKDMQYPDVGTQYRSEIFYDNENQKKTAEEKKEFFNKKFNGKIETNISEIKNYYKAEVYHQKYIMKRGR
jgi:peptide-methionine (S)-S-oxide reductase